ncbi:unnamed protein product [Danaus chrysippus]|uniref:(African queen) hypothetical protein n=1 Tax=Danaus chrysippus TaxID=151541 RepID=A0A8J2W5D7_9NEOP|nr:unnamed protein product [Danaus chrysippus]
MCCGKRRILTGTYPEETSSCRKRRFYINEQSAHDVRKCVVCTPVNGTIILNQALDFDKKWSPQNLSPVKAIDPGMNDLFRLKEVINQTPWTLDLLGPLDNGKYEIKNYLQSLD